MATFGDQIDLEARNDPWAPKGGYKLGETVQYMNPADNQWYKNGKVTKIIDAGSYTVSDSSGTAVYELLVDKVKCQPSASGPDQNIQIQFVQLDANASRMDMMTAMAKMFGGMTTIDPYTLSEEEIEKSFLDLDANKDGTLSFAEVKAYLHGKYGLDGDNVKTAFDIHAHTHGKDVVKSLDLEEFKAICHQANNAVKVFNDEARKDANYYWWDNQGPGFGVGCSVCTGCISLCIVGCATAYYSEDLTSRANTRSERLNALLSATLIKPEVQLMDRAC